MSVEHDPYREVGMDIEHAEHRIANPELVNAAPAPTVAEREDLKQRLIRFFHRTGHVTKEGAEAVAEGAISIVFAGKFGE